MRRGIRRLGLRVRPSVLEKGSEVGASPLAEAQSEVTCERYANIGETRECPRVTAVVSLGAQKRHLQAFSRSPLTDSNRRPPPYHRATKWEARAKPGSRGHESRARRRNLPKTSDPSWTRVPAVVFPQCSLRSGAHARASDEKTLAQSSFRPTPDPGPRARSSSLARRRPSRRHRRRPGP